MRSKKVGGVLSLGWPSAPRGGEASRPQRRDSSTKRARSSGGVASAVLSSAARVLRPKNSNPALLWHAPPAARLSVAWREAMRLQGALVELRAVRLADWSFEYMGGATGWQRPGDRPLKLAYVQQGADLWRLGRVELPEEGIARAESRIRALSSRMHEASTVLNEDA